MSFSKIMKTLMRTWAEVSLDNLEHNYREIRRHVTESCKFLGVMVFCASATVTLLEVLLSSTTFALRTRP